VSGMIKFTRKDFKTMQVDQFSSLVLQACFQLIVFIINFFL
jgi:hypothetical protein